jgi:hypothetical protein
VGGYQVAFGAAAAMLGAGAVILAVGLRRRHLEGLELGLTTTAAPVEPPTLAGVEPARTPAREIPAEVPREPEWAALESSGSSA